MSELLDFILFPFCPVTESNFGENSATTIYSRISDSQTVDISVVSAHRGIFIDVLETIFTIVVFIIATV